MGVAVKLTLCPEQIEVEEAVIDTEGVTDEATVMVMVFEVAVVGEAQAALEVIVTVTWSPLASELDEKLELLVPTFAPLTCH